MLSKPPKAQANPITALSVCYDTENRHQKPESPTYFKIGTVKERRIQGNI